jgi:hypothetical protein
MGDVTDSRPMPTEKPSSGDKEQPPAAEPPESPQPPPDTKNKEAPPKEDEAPGGEPRRDSEWGFLATVNPTWEEPCAAPAGT